MRAEGDKAHRQKKRPGMAKKQRLGLRAHFLQFYFRKLAMPLVWGASRVDWERLGKALGDSEKRFFAFEDPSGLIVCINLGQVQLVRCTWEPPAQPRALDIPDGLRAVLEGREPLVLSVAEKKPLGLAAELEDLDDVDDAIQWMADNELIALRVDEILYLEYPAGWESSG